MATKLERSNFAELLTPVHRKVFFDSYNKKKKQYTEIFKVDEMHAKEETFPHLGAFGKWAENAEGNDFNQADILQGEVATFTARRFDKAYEDSSALFSPDERVDTQVDGTKKFIELKWHDILDRAHYADSNGIRTYYDMLKDAKEFYMGRLFNSGYTMLPA